MLLSESTASKSASSATRDGFGGAAAAARINCVSVIGLSIQCHAGNIVHHPRRGCGGNMQARQWLTILLQVLRLR